jgi:nucleoid DNA-binding protein
VTKTELVDKVAEALGQSRTEAQRTLETVLENIAAGLASDRKVQIQGFGTFFAKTRKARMGRNPQTKEPMQIPASKTVTFKPGQDLKNRL